MRLELSTWQEVESYLTTSRAIMIPIGSTEQHGPTGLLGTDSLTAEKIALAAAENIGALVGPTINIGMAQHHLGFPGTITLRPSTLLQYLVDYVSSLRVHGFDSFYFLNGHGGNVATLTAAFSEIYSETSFAGAAPTRPSVRCAYQNWWMGSRLRQASRDFFAGKEGSHATPSEISVTYYLYPDSVKDAPLEPPTAPTGRIRDAQDYRHRFPDGRIGSAPAGASVEAGQRLFEAAVADVADDYRAFLAAT